MSYSHVTLSFSLPRSRSQWLSWLYGHAVKSWHDPLKHCTHPLDLKRMIDEHGQDRLFIADTAAILFHRTITESLPGAKFLYVVRPLDDVLLSMRRQVGSPLTKTMTHMHQRLRTFARDALPNHACEYQSVDAFARYHWPGEPREDFFWQCAADTKIDVPINNQEHYPEKTRRLMVYIER